MKNLDYQAFLTDSSQFLLQVLERLKKKGEYYSPTHPYEHIDLVVSVVKVKRHEVILVHIMKHLLGLIHHLSVNSEVKRDVVDEHVGDIINYLLLLRGAVSKDLTNEQKGIYLYNDEKTCKEVKHE